MRRLVSSSTLLVALVSCLFILPACDSGGSSGGRSDEVAGSADLSEPNAFEFSFGSSSNSLKADFAKAASKYQGYAFQWQATTTINGTTQEYYALFFTSKSSNKDEFGSDAAEAKVFGALIGEFSDLPSSDTYTAGTASNQSDFFGWIGQDFDSGPNGERTLQILTDADIQIGRNNGNLVVTSLSGEAFQYTADFQNGTAQDVSTSTVTIDLNGSIQPSRVNTFTESGDFSFTFSGGN